MRHARSLLACAIALAGCSSSSSENLPDGPTPDAPSGAGRGEPTAIGTPSGAGVMATLGAAGGTLTSGDGVVRLVVPAGALAADVALGIEPIDNQTFGGLGGGYRLTPGDQEFLVPVQVIMGYTDAEIAGMFPEALGVAVQDADAVWHAKATVALDTGAHTLTVSTQRFSVKPLSSFASAVRPADGSTHTDWTRFWQYLIVPGTARVMVNQKQTFQVEFCTVSAPTIGWPVEDAREIAHCNPGAPLAGVTLGAWSLEGLGGLAGDGAHATYTAPGSVPDQNTCRHDAAWNACAVNQMTILVDGKATTRDAYAGLDVVCSRLMLRAAPAGAADTCAPPLITAVEVSSVAGTVSDTSIEVQNASNGDVVETVETTQSAVAISLGDRPTLCQLAPTCEGRFDPNGAVAIFLPVRWAQGEVMGHDKTVLYDNPIDFPAAEPAMTGIGIVAFFTPGADVDIVNGTAAVETSNQVVGLQAITTDVTTIQVPISIRGLQSGNVEGAIDLDATTMATIGLGAGATKTDTLHRSVHITFEGTTVACPQCN